MFIINYNIAKLLINKNIVQIIYAVVEFFVVEWVEYFAVIKWRYWYEKFVIQVTRIYKKF